MHAHSPKKFVMDETTAVKRFSGNSLHSSPPPSTYIPLDIIPETILCRLPVKSLLRFRCISNSWNSLISKDLKFAKKHLRVSSKRQHLVTTTWREAEELTVMCCPFDSLNLLSDFDSKSTQLDYSPIISPYDDGYNDGLVASCDGILCFAIDLRLAVLYNPCIRKLQKLPDIDLPREHYSTHYAFGYDPFIDNYKVVAVIRSASKLTVHTYTLGTDSWKRIKNFPSELSFHSLSCFTPSKHGIFMRDTVNWVTYSESIESWGEDVIVSLHLRNESYEKISLPDLSHYWIYENPKICSLYVMQDCLCVFVGTEPSIEVWVMKEYGNKESWIKLIHLPSIGCYGYVTDIVYISEDNNALFVFNNNRRFKWFICENDAITLKRSKTEDNKGRVKSKIYVESLISPC